MSENWLSDGLLLAQGSGTMPLVIFYEDIKRCTIVFTTQECLLHYHQTRPTGAHL